MKKLFVFIYLAAMTITLPAQTNLFEVGFVLGGSLLGGDLVRPDLGSTSDINLAYGLVARKYVHTNVAVRANLIHTTLTSSDTNYDRFDSRSFTSKTSLTEISLTVEYDILGHQRNFHDASGAVSPYIFLGAGAAFTDPNPTFDYTDENVEADLNADISTTRFVVPFGAGVRWNATAKWSLAFEVGARPTFSDYLDGVSMAANPDKNDWYGFGSLQFLYTLSGDPFGTK